MLGRFVFDRYAKLRKATIKLVMSVRLSLSLTVYLSARPSFRMDQRGSQWTEFNEISYMIIFRKSV